MELGLDQCIKLGKSLELTRREIDSVISDVFESFIGALYLDLGLDTVKEFLTNSVVPHIENEDIFFYDYKSELKEICDQEGTEITYELIKEEGKPHNKTFTITAIINDKKYGTGIGGSKKEAEQNAANEAMRKI